MPPPFLWTLVTFETRYQLFASKLDCRRFQNHPQLFSCFRFRSPLDSSNLCFLYVHGITLGMPQSMPSYVLPNHVGTLLPYLASVPRVTAPKFSFPFPSIQTTFEIKEIKRKSLLVWKNVISSFKLKFKCKNKFLRIFEN